MAEVTRPNYAAKLTEHYKAEVTWQNSAAVWWNTTTEVTLSK